MAEVLPCPSHSRKKEREGGIVDVYSASLAGKMTQRSATKMRVIFFFSLVLAFFVWHFHQLKAPPGHASPNQTSTSPIIIEGFSNTIYEGELLVSKIEANQFKIVPRKFFVFNVKSVNEAMIKNMRLSLYLNSRDEKTINLLPFLEILPTQKQSLKLKGMGYITRGVIRGLDIKIYHDQKPSFHLSGEKAILNLKEKKMEIKTARLENFATGEVFTSRNMVWHSEKNRLDIPGKYRLHSASTQKMGQGITLPLLKPIHP